MHVECLAASRTQAHQLGLVGGFVLISSKTPVKKGFLKLFSLPSEPSHLLTELICVCLESDCLTSKCVLPFEPLLRKAH